MKLITNAFYIVILSSLSFSAVSEDMAAIMKQQMEEGMADTCNDRAFLSCMGVSKNKCSSATKKAAADCDYLFPKGNELMGDESAFKQHGECIESHILKYTGTNADKLDSCDTMLGDGTTGNEPPVSMDEGIAMLNQVMQQNAKSIGTDNVTLPIYKNAKVMSHFNASQSSEMMSGITGTPNMKALPALVLTSSDNVKNVVTFYEKKLKGFRKHSIDGDILFMKGGPEKFDMLKHLKIYVATPHVMISPMNDGPGIPVGTKSMIEIAYKE